MTLTSGGNLGIGTTSPTSTLDLTNGSDTAERAIRIENSSARLYVGVEGSSGNRFVGSATNNGFIGTTTADGIEFATNNNVRMTLTSGGNLGIGTSDPTRKLHVQSAASAPCALFGNSANNNSIELTRITSAASYIALQAYSSTGGLVGGPTLTFSTANSGGGSVVERMRIDSSGRVIIQDDVAYTANAPIHRGSLILAGASGFTNYGGLEFHTSSGGGAGYGTRIVSSDANLLFGRRFNAATWSESMRIDNNGNVGIGTTSPDSIFHVKSASGVHRSRFESASSHSLVRLIAGTGSNAGIEFYSGAGNVGNITADSSSNLLFEPGGTEKVRIDSGGSIRLGGSTTNGTTLISSCTSTSTNGGNGTGNTLELEFMEPSSPNFGAKKIKLGVQGGGYVKMDFPGSAGLYMYNPYGDTDRIHLGYGGIRLDMLYGGSGGTQNMLIRSKNDIHFSAGSTEKVRFQANGGISFNGDTAAANALDDYEEGVYQVTLEVQSGTASLASGYDYLAYTKVGRQVTINGRIRFGNISASGYLRLSLPFANVGNLTAQADYAYFNCPGHNVNVDSDIYGVFAEAGPGVSSAVLLQQFDNIGWGYWNANNFSNGDYVYFSGTYFTA
jgi:hypothetical protein